MNAHRPDPELERFSAGLRRRFPLHYEAQLRHQRSELISKLVIGAVGIGWLIAAVLM